MTPPIKFELKSVIDTDNIQDIDGLKKALLSRSKLINVKDHADYPLAMITEKHIIDNKQLTPLERECRSIVIDKNTLDVVCYTYDDIIYNDDAKQILASLDQYDEKKIIIQECLEGTFIAVYNYQDQWYISTRRCIDANYSIWKSNKSHKQLFEEIIYQKYNMKIEEFYEKLNKDYCYYFVLVHHENQNIVDYSDIFGENFQEIILVMIRDRNTHIELPIDDYKKYINIDIRVPKIYADFSLLDETNKQDSQNGIKTPLKMEGLIVKVYDPETGKNKILKLQTNSYKMLFELTPNNNNIYRSFIELYQKNMLKEHLKYYEENAKIYNPNFEELPYDTIGVIDATFKVMTSELNMLYRKLYDIDGNKIDLFVDANGIKQSIDIYNILPGEYKTALYKIRGIIFAKKNLRINDIYNLLKNIYGVADFVKLLKARMNLKIKIDEICNITDIMTKDTLEEITYKMIRDCTNECIECTKLKLKMIAILQSRLFIEKKVK